MAVTVVAALVVGVAMWSQSPPGPITLGNALDAVVPEDSELVEETSSGNVVCFDACPTVRRTYVVTASRSDALDHVRTALRDAGYDLREPEEEGPMDPFAFMTERKNGLYITGRVEPRTGESISELRLTARG